MLFTQWEFAVFLIAVFAGYWMIQGLGPDVSDMRLRLRNLFVVTVSYVFYGWWDWRFLLLIFLTSVSSFVSGLLLERTDNTFRRKSIIAWALLLNLGLLGVFKYHGFFLDNLSALLEAIGFQKIEDSLKIILPVGISFYTFQAVGYVIDVYRGEIKASRDLWAFLAFVSFFPQLVAGPIERAVNLLPQFHAPLSFDRNFAVEGLRQMLWGFLKKVLVADSCAYAANSLLGRPDASGLEIWGGRDDLFRDCLHFRRTGAKKFTEWFYKEIVPRHRGRKRTPAATPEKSAP